MGDETALITHFLEQYPQFDPRQALTRAVMNTFAESRMALDIGPVKVNGHRIGAAVFVDAGHRRRHHHQIILFHFDTMKLDVVHHGTAEVGNAKPAQQFFDGIRDDGRIPGQPFEMRRMRRQKMRDERYL